MEIQGFWIPRELLEIIFAGSVEVYRSCLMLCRKLRRIVREGAKGIGPRFQDIVAKSESRSLVKFLNRALSEDLTEKILKLVFRIPDFVINFANVAEIKWIRRKYIIITQKQMKYWYTICSQCGKIYAENVNMGAGKYSSFFYECCMGVMDNWGVGREKFRETYLKFWIENFEF